MRQAGNGSPIPFLSLRSTFLRRWSSFPAAGRAASPASSRFSVQDLRRPLLRLAMSFAHRAVEHPSCSADILAARRIVAAVVRNADCRPSSPPMPNSSTSARAMPWRVRRSPPQPIDRSSSSSSSASRPPSSDADVVEQLAARDDVAVRRVLVADVSRAPRRCRSRMVMRSIGGACGQNSEHDGVAGLVRGQHPLLAPASARAARSTRSGRARCRPAWSASRALLAQADAGDGPAQGVEVVAAERRARPASRSRSRRCA